MKFNFQKFKRTLYLDFDQATYARGEAYFNQGRVTITEQGDQINNELVFIANITGSIQHIYRAVTEISTIHNGSKVYGNCSCPVAYNCKHVVAACLAIIEKNTAPPANAGLTWLKDFVETQHAPPKKITPNMVRHSVIFVINSARYGQSLDIEAYESRPKKSGVGNTKLKHLSRESLIKPKPEKYNPADLSNISRLASAQRAYYWQAQDLTLSVEDIDLLKNIIIHSHCVAGEPTSPKLTWGDPLALTFLWKETNDQWTLEHQIGPNNCHSLFTSPSHYIDPDTHTVGEITLPALNQSQWNLIDAAPTLTHAQAQEFSQVMINLPTPLPIPAPIEQNVTEITSTPTPILLLFKDQAIKAFSLALSFRYGDFELPYKKSQAITQKQKDGIFYKITPQHEFEQLCYDQINALFSPLATHPLFGRYFFQEQEEESLFFLDSPTERDAIQEWDYFLTTHIPKLEAQGWEIKQSESSTLNLLEADQVEASVTATDNNWFEMNAHVQINNQSQPLLPIISQILDIYPITDLPDILYLPTRKESEYLKIPKSVIDPIIQTLRQLFSDDQLSRNAPLNLQTFDAPALAELADKEDHNLQITGAENLIKLGKKLTHFTGIETATPPASLNATLRDYQQEGLNWMQFLREYQFNGILADDMGLGKTLQTLAHILLEKEQERLNAPCLVIAPTSLMSNWRQEAEKFCPSLRVLTLHGPERAAHFEHTHEYDIVLSTYPLISRDEDMFTSKDWYYIILDESQYIKNPTTKANRILQKLNSQHRLCLTGTPMENHLGEIWSQYNFLMPGFLHSQKAFNQTYRKGIEQEGNNERAQQLTKRINPFLLRRTKDVVAKELPPKTEVIRYAIMQDKQSQLYDGVRISMQKKVRDAIAQNGLSKSHIMVLDALLKLRQTCCDPSLLKLDAAQLVKESAKLTLLMDMLPEMVEEGRKILLFSQFTGMLSIIEKALKKEKITYTKLTGQTRKRDEAINAFQNGDANVFLISLKAGGVGLNLTQADTVIIYDPWWNPAAEEQAAARAYRIGQDKPVFVYKLIVKDSIEEKILAMQERKKKLADNLYQDKGQENKKTSTFTADDIKELFQ